MSHAAWNLACGCFTSRLRNTAYRHASGRTQFALQAEESHASDILLASNANPQISPGSSGNSEDSDDDGERAVLGLSWMRLTASRDVQSLIAIKLW